MKITFVAFEDENLGVQYVAEYLKRHGHQVSLVFDPKQFNKAYGRFETLSRIFDWGRLNLNQLRLLNPDLIAFSCTTATYGSALSFAKLVKSRFDKPIIFGGVHPTLAPDAVIENPEVDMVCVGEGEEALLEFAEAFDKGTDVTGIRNLWFKIGGEIIRNPVRELPEDIEQFGMDRSFFWDILPSNYRENAYYLTSRGCPFKCTYCGNEQKFKVYKGKGKFVRQMSVERVLEDLLILKEKYHTKSVLFEDDIFTMNRKWLRDFIGPYVEKIGLPFTCFIHPKHFDDELGQLLKDGGCRLTWFGIQSGDENIRKNILARLESNEDVIRAADLCKKYGLKFMVDHIFDIPYDDNIMESFRLYTRIKPSMINCYNLLYFPRAKVIEHAREAGILSDEDVEKINRGETVVYQTGIKSSDKEKQRQNYQKYALLMTSIPLLPDWLIKKILARPDWIDFFGRLPILLVPMVKIFLNVKIGHGFLPFTVIKTELYWVLKFIEKNIRLKSGSAGRAE